MRNGRPYKERVDGRWMKYTRNAPCSISAAGSADSEMHGRREDTLDFTALKMFRKGEQIVGAVHHLAVDGPGFDNAFAPVLLQAVAVKAQHLANFACREEHRTVALAAQVLEQQQGLRKHEMPAKEFLEKSGLYQIIDSFCYFV